MKNSKSTTLASKKRLDYKWVIIAACIEEEEDEEFGI